MEIYLSPVYVIILGIFIVGIFSTLKLPNALIASIALVLVVYTIYLHVYIYSTEYRVMSTGAWVQNLAPTLLIAVVILMSVAYIIYFFKSDSPKTQNTGGSSFNPLSMFSGKKTKTSDDTYNSIKSNLTPSERREYSSDIDRLI
jgi:hypothetical protein